MSERRSEEELVKGRYISVAPSLSSGDEYPLRLTSDGKLMTSDPTVEGKVDDVEDKMDVASPKIDAIKAKTDNLPSDPADESLLEAALTTKALEDGGRLQDVETDVNNVTVPLPFPSTIAQDTISVVTATDTTEKEITIALPTGASIVRVMLAVLVAAKNASANAQDIDISVSGRPSGGSWSTLISTLTDVWGLPAVNSSTTGDALLADVSTLVSAVGTYGFKCTITQSSANGVNYKTQYLLQATYKMS